MTLLIGAGYKARAGKNTFIEAVHARLPCESRIYSFATALKCYCRVQGWMTVKDGPILQYVGTELFRKKNPDFWIDMVRWQIEEEKPQIALFSDVRFKNELAYIKSNDGISIKVSRVNVNGIPYVSNDRPANHLSEIDLDGEEFDFYITATSGDISAIETAADTLATIIRGRLKLCQSPTKTVS